MLGVAVGWLLEKNRIEYQAGGYAGDQELDYRFELREKRILIECKMFKTHKDDEAIEQHLIGAIKQAIRHVDEIVKTERIDATWILTNHELDAIEGPLSRALARYEKEMKARSIELMDVADLSGAISDPR